MKVVNKKSLALSIMLIFSMMVLIILTNSVTVLADGSSTWAGYAKGDSTGSFVKEKGDVDYPKTGGGSIKGKDILGTDGLISESNFKKLTPKGQEQFIHDLNEWALGVLENNSTSDVYTEDTLAEWYAVLQTKDGVGTKFMNVILENTKPDFVSANRIYKPFSGLVGTLMGVGAVFLMGFLGIVMVADIAYITLPPVRLFVSEANEGSRGNTAKIASSKIFSHDALYAVKVAEENDDSGKQALGVYFKRRVFMLILLGICLLYLVQGRLYSLVGGILDLLSGIV